MTPGNELVARNVRRLREQRGLSLTELARRSGLAKQTVSKLELGTGNPTVDTLYAIAGALEAPITRLLATQSQLIVVQRADEVTWQCHDGYSSRELDHIYGSGVIENYVLRLEGTDGAVSEAHPPGTLEHLYVIAGRARVGPVEAPIELDEGDFARFPGDRQHLYQALRTPCVVSLVVSVPQARPGTGSPSTRNGSGTHHGTRAAR